MERELESWLESYLKCTNNSEPSIMYRLWSAIAVISSALQRKCWLNWGTLTFYPSIYIILVGPPAARKGTAMNQAYPFLKELDVKLAATATTYQALIRALAEASYTSVTELGSMYFHNSMTIWSQELTVFLGYENKDLMAGLCDWYDCKDNWVYRTKHQGTDEINGVFVTLYGATTPVLIRACLPVDAVGSGLTSRIIFVYEANKGKVVPYPGLSDEEKKIEELLKRDLHKIHMLSGRFVVTKDFVECWMDWYTKQDGNPPFQDERFAGYFERRATHVMKLCMIVNSSRTDEMVINNKDLFEAVSILEKTEIKMPRTFTGMGKAQHAEVLARVMADVAMDKMVLFSTLIDRYKNDADKWLMEKIIETLIAMKYIVILHKRDDIEVHYAKTFVKQVDNN